MADVGAVNSIIPVQNPIKTSDGSAFEPTKPILPRMLALHMSLGKTGDQASHYVLDRLEHERTELQVWSKQEMDHLVAVANRTWMEHAWSSLKTVADSVISVVSFAMGLYFLNNKNTAAGSFLILSGGFNILQSIFLRPGMWDWISEILAEKNEATRERLKMALPIIVALLSLAFSRAGVKYLQPNELINALEQVKNAVSIGGQGVSSYLSIKKGLDEARQSGIQAELKQHEQTTDMLARLVDYFIKENRRIKSTIKKPINALMQASTLAAQKV